jgi:BirA family biotin operon repressor/biotin-[acetyl-CoA-carboxylase] ligase
LRLFFDKSYKSAKILTFIYLNTILQTLFVGKNCFDLETVPSTNVFALSLLAQKKIAEGTIVIARSQTAGKGQLTNVWESEPNKNITLSVVFYPSFLQISNHFLLNQAIALGVHDFIQIYVKKQIKIKWSNDIYIENKKVAGILIQNSLQGNTLQHSVVGIGININQTIFLSDAPNPTSLTNETGEYFNLDAAISFLCKCLEERYLQLRQQKFQQLRIDYANALYQRDEWRNYERVATQERFLGKIEGVKETGHLILQTIKGLEIFDLKEIKFL